jgi:hypothetical protein
VNKHRVTIPAGTVVHLFGVPMRLEADTAVYSETIAIHEDFDTFVGIYGEQVTRPALHWSSPAPQEEP